MSIRASDGEMARSSLILSFSWFLPPMLLLLMFVFISPAVLATELHNDDSDYEFDEDYEYLPEKRSSTDDDLYIAGDLAKDVDRRAASSSSKEEDIVPSDDANTGEWTAVERTYRYTKHRIPGYDYDELDYYDSRCDERSVWTHCVCQFTCAEPNIVDCYSPCNSGCECREDFVFDPHIRACVTQNQCTPNDEFLIY
ncbi:hypothetical protein QAD02_010677 [Eretmocerus hayati]|uniref:Uncharacterized protein n=1 Tax=Eretmocerus hayati TaxID=131215 RepID=A0ACC2NWB3_9HYME|nr:hypothetical protein QAD02_010677 [Eretmocerus hayati]